MRKRKRSLELVKLECLSVVAFWTVIECIPFETFSNVAFHAHVEGIPPTFNGMSGVGSTAHEILFWSS
jgi:hypothetical protein